MFAQSWFESIRMYSGNIISLTTIETDGSGKFCITLNKILRIPSMTWIPSHKLVPSPRSTYKLSDIFSWFWFSKNYEIHLILCFILAKAPRFRPFENRFLPWDICQLFCKTIRGLSIWWEFVTFSSELFKSIFQSINVKLLI